MKEDITEKEERRLEDRMSEGWKTGKPRRKQLEGRNILGLKIRRPCRRE